VTFKDTLFQFTDLASRLLAIISKTIIIRRRLAFGVWRITAGKNSIK
jgi:hypothetical protein